MIVPSIDLQGGHAVQLIGGEQQAIDAGDPAPIMERFRLAGDVAVIDLDRALSKGDNDAVIERLITMGNVRVGGGIRSVERALHWLNKGAAKIILGTAATPELLGQLPKDRLIAALDARHGEVVVEGWTKATGANVIDRIAQLKEYVGGFLVTFVEREGRMEGTDLEFARAIVAAAAPAKVTIAGGVTTTEELAELDRIGADAQVGMALYSGRMDLGDAIAAPLVSDRQDGLIPTVVADERGVALGLVYSSRESIRHAVAERRGIYWSRSRGALWRKGESSGDVQELLAITPDCDRDALRFTVRQHGPGFCHLGCRTCFGADGGLGALSRLLQDRRANPPPGSYTARLFEDPAMLAAKLREECEELIEASEHDHIVHEAADVIYFTLVRLAGQGIDLAEVERHLDRRHRRVTRRD
ncbi:MAG TPA: phosphoribosyl-ATP diphosphatase [Geminicoccus sp.]|uniref:phosphoribosyl-ATP diphosphatase n=1 Tax=Geminicoccus sp. TaxID=2024832 RepID=UPI002C55ECD9|nr:phosphoribosyl-ATP diphosphatase [Geminicoccus sp.]HWL68081.1 phosphoribosyl-ATP diphosphatase [Geminicoccus sp.]